jgi:hypothetical protein
MAATGELLFVRIQQATEVRWGKARRSVDAAEAEVGRIAAQTPFTTRTE